MCGEMDRGLVIWEGQLLSLKPSLVMTLTPTSIPLVFVITGLVRMTAKAAQF